VRNQWNGKGHHDKAFPQRREFKHKKSSVKVETTGVEELTLLPSVVYESAQPVRSSGAEAKVTKPRLKRSTAAARAGLVRGGVRRGASLALLISVAALVSLPVISAEHFKYVEVTERPSATQKHRGAIISFYPENPHSRLESIQQLYWSCGFGIIHRNDFSHRLAHSDDSRADLEYPHSHSYVKSKEQAACILEGMQRLGDTFECRVPVLLDGVSCILAAGKDLKHKSGVAPYKC
jgi:hypothetical protein